MVQRQWDYKTIKAEAKRQGRIVEDFYALKSDPFYMTPAEERDAEWFADLWYNKLGIGVPFHLRRVHYRIVINITTLGILLPNGRRYVNTLPCFQKLCMRHEQHGIWGWLVLN